MPSSLLEIVVLGCSGGPFENNLSSYLLIDREKKEAVVFDGGSLLHGLNVAFEKGALKEFVAPHEKLSPVGAFFLNNIKAYLISHVHLDHIMALIIASQMDSAKAVLGTDETIDNLRDYAFNGKLWDNFANEGTNPASIYRYERLKFGKAVSIPNTRMRVEPFLLSHSKTLHSSAFLVECQGEYVLYFGDTSSDFVEREKNNEIIWKKVAPLVREKRLKAIFLECSYPNLPSNRPLYGHLTPKLFLEEMTRLFFLAGAPLKGIKVIVTHRKDTLAKNDDRKDQIAKELLEEDKLGIDFVFPTQGQKILL